MGATVGSLLVDMALNTAAFASDLGKAKGAVDSWAASHNQVLAGVVNAWRGVTHEMHGFIEEAFSLKTALLGLVGGGLIGELVKSNLEAATSLVHHADAIGITTTALQEYQYVAKMSGISTETLTGSLEKFGKQLGQLEAGTGTLYTYLQKTNTGLLEQVKSAGSVDQALDILLKTMAGYDSQQSKLALSAAAFGKGGLEMVNMVKDGAEAMEELKQKALDLGIVVGGDLLRGAQAAQEKLETLGMILKSQLMIAVISNAAEIEHLAQGFINILPAIIKFGEVIVGAIGFLLDFKTNIMDANLVLMKMGATATETGMAIASLFKGGPSDDDLANKLQKDTAEIEAYEKKINDMKANKASGTVYGPEQQHKPSIDTSGLIADAQAQNDAAAKADAAYKKLEASAKHTWESIRTPLEKYNDEMLKLNQELDAGLISQDTYNRAVDKLGTSLNEAQNKGSLFFDVMSKGISGGIKNWRDLGGAVMEYAQKYLQALATGQSTSGFNIMGAAGGMGGLFSGVSSALSSAGSFISSFFHSGGIVGSSGGTSRRVSASVFQNAPRFHSGGLVGGEVPAILQKGERVLTAAQQQNMGGGGDTYYIDARGADAGVEERLRAMIEGLSNSVEPRAISAVVDARNRNPSLF